VRAEQGTLGLTIRLLGRFEVMVAARVVPASSWRLRKAATLVKLLALADGHRMHREVMMDRLWPDRDLAAAANNLHQVLHAARRALDPGGADSVARIGLHHEVVCLCPDGGLWVDVEAFEALAAVARQCDTAAAYRRALELYGGELLPDEPYEDCWAGRREALRTLRVGLLLGLAAAGRRDGLAVAEIYRQALAADPYNELACRGLMGALAEAGDRAGALREHDALAVRVREELGVEPSEAVEALAEAIRAGGETGTPRGSRPAPPLEPIGLPTELTSFVGRERELADVQQVLTRTRLLTLVGAGGCGKTRLAVEAARQASPSGGVFFADLATVSDPGLVVAGLARAVGVAGHAGDLVGSVAGVLDGRRALVVIDNCEHVVGEAAGMVEELLRRTTAVAVLATSREPLGAAGEVVRVVGSLEVPDPDRVSRADDLVGYSGVQLLLDRAAAAAPHFALTDDNATAVARLCLRLDGMPLAIELAAGRLEGLSVEEIVERLENRFALLRARRRGGIDRQQTLAATLDWSYELLAPDERAVFRRLGWFVGGFSLDAAEAVCADSTTEPAEVADVVGRLVDKSLVVVEAPGNQLRRYRLYESVREYARRRLRQADETDSVAQRCEAWYLALAEAARGGLAGPTQASWLANLEAERGNLAEAIRSALALRPADAAWLAGQLWRFWILKGHLREGRRSLEAVLAAPLADAERLLLLVGAAAIELRTASAGPAKARADEAVRLATTIDDPALLAEAAHLAGLLSLSAGEHRRAVTLLETAISSGDTAGRPVAAACARQALGLGRWAVGDPTAVALLQDSAAALGDLAGAAEVALAPCHIGWVRVPRHLGPGFRVRQEETIVQLHEVSAPGAYAGALTNLAQVAREHRDTERARALFLDALAWSRTAGDAVAESRALGYLAEMALAAGDLDGADTLHAQSGAIRRNLGELRGLGYTAMREADLAAARGQYRTARSLLEETLTMFDSAGDGPGVSIIAGRLVEHLLRWGDPQGAVPLLERAVTAISGHNQWSRYWLWELAEATFLVGDGQRAKRLAEEALAGFEANMDRGGAEGCGAWLAALNQGVLSPS
jgi:predicted ATPase/DNA-binding SARP family transcriptional activator